MNMGAPLATPSGILFPANASGKSYISLNAHRGNGNRRYKNKWGPHYTPPMEHALFCRADSSAWRDGRGHHWAIHANGTVEIGDRGEIIAKFPFNANSGDPWHGYPVEPQDGRDNDCPPDAIVLAWINATTVSETLGFRIMRRRV
jgi:hypothetical protein